MLVSKSKFTILINQNTFIELPEFGLLLFLFWDNGKNAKYYLLAPMEGKILF
jgi:hypothetical protein